MQNNLPIFDVLLSFSFFHQLWTVYVEPGENMRAQPLSFFYVNAYATYAGRKNRSTRCRGQAKMFYLQTKS